MEGPRPLGEGRREAEAAGRALKGTGPYHVAFTSALTRAQHTLKRVLGQIGQEDLETIADKALNERDYGDLSGLNKDEGPGEMGRGAGPHLAPLLRHQPARRREPARHGRARPALLQPEDPAARARGQNVLVAAHGNSLRSLIMVLDGLSPKEIVGVELETGVPIVYRLNPDSTVASKEILKL